MNPMKLVNFSKEQLQLIRNDGGDSFLNQVSSLYGKFNVDVPNMEDMYVAPRLTRPKGHKVTTNIIIKSGYSMMSLPR